MRRLATTLALVLTVLAFSACGKKTEVVSFQTHQVRKGDLRISIQQKGAIEPREPTKVLNPLEGQTTILDIVPEGNMVKEGDWLFELDVSEARDRLLQQEIATSTAKQSLFNTEQQLEIQRQQNESDVKRAELDVRFAELDFKQYVEGDLPRERETVEAEITLGREELERAKDTYTWSGKLAEKGYISNDKLESDRLAVRRREIDLDLARRKQDVLENYTSKKRQEELESNLAEGRRELKRVLAKTAANLAQAEGDVERRRDQHELEVTKLQRLKKQVENNVVTAPRAGLVVYGRESRGRDSKPIEPGSQVREGQEILTIPDMTLVDVDVDVHESWVGVVQIGQPVIITTDTGDSVVGKVLKIAAVPDSQSWYRNPDLKVYSTTVAVDNSAGKLRPGMNCSAEIIITELKNVISLPVQAVYSNGRDSYCYVKAQDGSAELRQIVPGLHNNILLEIQSGLGEGDLVFLSMPPKAKPIPLIDPEEMRPTVVMATDDVSGGAVPAAGDPGEAGETGDTGRRRGNRNRPGREGGEGEGGGEGRRGGRGRPEISPEMRKQLEEETKDMTPEQKMEYFRKKFANGGRGEAGS